MSFEVPEPLNQSDHSLNQLSLHITPFGMAMG